MVVGDSHFIDVGDLVADLDGEFFVKDGIAALARQEGQWSTRPTRSLTTVRLGPPVARPHQILCIGLNYVDHAQESRMTVPTEPTVFTKPPNTLVGPNDDIVRPPGAKSLDYEVELGVIVGRRCQYLESREEALASIAGFVLSNDVSERDMQFRGEGQWLKGKSSATFNPCGPFFVTPDEIEIAGTDLWLDVDDRRRQSGSTAHMVFDVAEILIHLSAYFVLEPGDLVNTGTPPGVAFGMDPPEYLQPGQVVSAGGRRLGQQRSRVRDYSR